MVEGEEKSVNVNEVPEYAAEIHTYLREMEVRHLSELKVITGSNVVSSKVSEVV